AAEVSEASIRVVEPDTESDAQRTLLEVFKTQRYSFSTYPALENTPRAADLYAAACSLAGTSIHERGGRKYVVRLNAGLYLKGENTFTEDANAAEVFWTL